MSIIQIACRALPRIQEIGFSFPNVRGILRSHILFSRECRYTESTGEKEGKVDKKCGWKESCCIKN